MSSGVVKGPFPSFQRRGGRAAAGVVSKRSRSAPYFSLKLLTTPSAPLRNGIFLLRRSHPSLKTEGNGPLSQPTSFPLRPASQPGGTVHPSSLRQSLTFFAL